MQQLVNMFWQSNPLKMDGTDLPLGITGIALAKLPQFVPQIDQTLANVFVGIICLTLVVRASLSVAYFVAERRDKHRERRKRRERSGDDQS